MTILLPDDIRAAIHHAWQDSAPPPPDRISAPTYDDEGVAAYFCGRTWREHEVAALRYHSVGLSFFTAEAFCYYLPAYMLAVLADPEAADVIYDSILFHLSPEQLGKQWADSYRARIAGFTEEQKRAISAYLSFCGARCDDDSHSRREIDETIAYLAGGPARVADTPTARLLQLAGHGDRAAAEISRLSLSSTTVCDGDLAGLAAFPSLRELDLASTQLTDAGLAQLAAPAVAAALGSLQRLDLSGGTQLTAAGLGHLAALPRLAELKLSNTNLDDAGLAALAPLALQRLHLIHAHRLTDSGWRALDVSALEELAMFGVSAPDALLRRLGEVGKLRRLDCKSVSEAGLVSLCRNRALAHLEVSEAATIGAAGLAALATLPALQRLQLGGLPCARWPAGFPALTELTLLDSELDAEGAAGLAQLPALAELGFFGVRLGAGALGQLARLRALRRFTLWCQGVGDDSLRELAGSPLQELSVHRAAVGNAALAVVEQLPELTELRLDGLAIDDQAMRHLSRAAKLRALQLDAVPVGDTGLAQLARCPALRTLQLSGTRATAEGIAALRLAAPRMEVVEV